MHRVLHSVTRLDIAAAGVGPDGAPFVCLKCGKEFVGTASRRHQMQYYRRLPSSVRQKLPFMCFNVAADIVIRYQEGGLKLGGPKKETRYTPRLGDAVAEMGAFQGFYTLRLADLVGEIGRVIAIEPIPSNVALLKRNVKANNCRQVTVVERGVWSCRDTMRFTLAQDNMQSASAILNDRGGAETEIPVDSLDDILDECRVTCIDFMVIQLNGAELEALEGMTRIKPRHLAIAARYGSTGRSTPEEIVSLLRQRGYVSEIDKGSFVFARLTDDE